MVNKELISLQLGRREQEVGYPSTVESPKERKKEEKGERGWELEEGGRGGGREQREERGRRCKEVKRRKMWRRDPVEGPGGMGIRNTWNTASQGKIKIEVKTM